MSRLRNNLDAAIATMRAACDDAERRAKHSDDAFAIQSVLHALSWGMANASTSIESAMAALEDQRQQEIYRQATD